ncbi:hypothetical protein LWI28_006179 [Acer negundo]|uniref:DUF4283 domain-containing protein n=1 Tax=Acer negundo TaxID=4023 RepID=A0AAD5IXT5_ACENE|nr:hypothetical protein LWI28_006179 [Acer negundo]
MQIQANPVWIYIPGIPLKHWNKRFLKKVGNRLGDFLFIEKDTILKRRMDRGKLLISLNDGRRCPNRLKVVDGKKSFVLTIEKDVTSMNFDWLGELLGLNFELPSKELFLSSDTEESWQPKSGDKIEKKSIEKWDNFKSWKEVRKTSKKCDKVSLSKLRAKESKFLEINKGQLQESGQREEQSWSSGEEITKVIEVVMALGFGFNNKEDTIGGVISQREKEDKERLGNINGR